MHSSRMRTVRCSSHLGGGRGLPGGCLPRGIVSGRGGGGLPPHPREQNHRHLWKHNLAAITLRTVMTATPVYSLKSPLAS